MSVDAVDPSTSPAPRGMRRVVLPIMFAIAATLFLVVALPYYGNDREMLAERNFWEPFRRIPLLTHISFGAVAVTSGLVQLATAGDPRAIRVHRLGGRIYASAIAISASAAFLLASTTEVGVVYALGLAGLGSAWLATTGMTLLALRAADELQHKEWALRSYVVTFCGFVFFRLIAGGLGLLGVEDVFDQIAIAAWACWSIPLMLAEIAIQRRRMHETESASARSIAPSERP